ncbi:MAG: PepSY domain-containing protein [Immundisolibacteraceae bacterium]|nr:PepSY domain-containing protein [Immundisolibacteraceae bacterium]
MSDNALRSTGFRKLMSGLHTWVGLIPGWVLFFMFVTGSAAYFRVEINQWMETERPYFGSSSDQRSMLEFAEARLHQVGTEADEWIIQFPDDRSDVLKIEWHQHLNEKQKVRLVEQGFSEQEIEEKKAALEKEEFLDPHTGIPLTYINDTQQVRDTHGGNALYQMHFKLHYLPELLAHYLVVICTLFMLVGLITGIVVHKKIFKEFFTFRPGKKQRSWLDAHNIFGVLSLPFQLMITYSGLMFFLSTIFPAIYLAPIALMGFDIANMQAASSTEELSPKNQALREVVVEELFNQPPELKPAHTAAPLTRLGGLLDEVYALRLDKNVRFVVIDNVNDLNARVRFWMSQGLNTGRQQFTFNGISGERIASAKTGIDYADSRVTAVEVNDILFDLHEGRYAPTPLRWLYFLSGLMGAGMIATGCILWAVKRHTRTEQSGHQPRGLLLVERLNVATFVGLPVAIAAYFWANRLLPVTMAHRADWEVNTLFLVWGLMFILAMLRPRQRIWVDQLRLAAVAYGLLPLLNFLNSDRHLGTSLVQGDWVVTGFDLTMLVVALSFGWAASRAHRARLQQTITGHEADLSMIGNELQRPGSSSQTSDQALS